MKRNTSQNKAAKPSISSKKGADVVDPNSVISAMNEQSFEDAYKANLAAAKALPSEQVMTCRAGAGVVSANVKLAMLNVFGDPEKDPAGVAAQVAAISEHLPKIDVVKMGGTMNLCRAFVFSSLQVVRKKVSSGDIEKHMKVISSPREDYLNTAETLAKRGFLDAAVVANIRAGSGKYDSAGDVVALIHLFRSNADTIKSLHPFTEAEFTTVLASGEWLLNNLTPDGAHPVKPTQKADAPDTLNRFWTLLSAQYDDLRKVGFYLFGDDLDEKLPKLQSRVMKSPVAADDGTDDSGAGESTTSTAAALTTAAATEPVKVAPKA